MKKLIALLGLLAFAGSAQASSLFIDGASAITFSNYDGQPAAITGTYSTGTLGTLMAGTAGVFSATYLGNESSYNNAFRFLNLGGLQLTELDAVGTTISMNVDAGAIGFKFDDSEGGLVGNGVTPGNDYSSFAILAGQCIQNNCFDYLLGFNDSFSSDADYDDFVVGVSLSPVPLPAAAWLFGSALVGFVSLSKKRRATSQA